MNTEKCRSLHFGPWLIEPDWMTNALAAIRNGTLPVKGETRAMDDGEDYPPEDSPYTVSNGLAVICIEGALMKARSKYGGTSTVDLRASIRMAVSDAGVTAILLVIDSPGGTVAGTDALGQDIAAADARKPVYAHVQDLCCSAAYWLASQTRRITAERTSLVGSLGAMASLVDSSKKAEMEGYKVIPVTTGGVKGAGIPGTEITPEQVAHAQQIIDTAGDHFKAAVREGRGFTEAQTQSLFDGRVHDAAVAKTLGLIDEVASLDAAVQAIFKEISTMNAEQFRAYAAEHSEAAEVKDLVARGYKAGEAAGRTEVIGRLKANIAVCGARPVLAFNATCDGKDADELKAMITLLDAEASQHKADLAAKDAEIEKLKAEKGKQGPLALGNQGNAAAAPGSDGGDPKAQAASEWDSDVKVRVGFSSKDNYVHFRAAELEGRHRSFTRKPDESK